MLPQTLTTSTWPLANPDFRAQISAPDATSSAGIYLLSTAPFNLHDAQLGDFLARSEVPVFLRTQVTAPGEILDSALLNPHCWVVDIARCGPDLHILSELGVSPAQLAVELELQKIGPEWVLENASEEFLGGGDLWEILEHLDGLGLGAVLIRASQSATEFDEDFLFSLVEAVDVPIKIVK
ncbi:hypothetical protein [Corynebacterium caspium]|uniref:hypothetical protein n=1 Tax=Corynebacterium caspium TaxID=234828 RepID=UPI00037C8CEB|nr:hypothetical protein [Corynebacterium caspium]WKD59030.1 hypothetical protein CCASP_03130 [Corynebacterium caspium DSM 44850]